MTLDRSSHRERPSRQPIGYQKWRSLLFLHWHVPADTLKQHLPRGLELDLFEGQAFVGLVPFAMRQVRPSWCPARLGFNFLELNVRTYVHDGKRTGVYFFSLDADSAIAVWIARNFWGLPYENATMSMSNARPGGPGTKYTFRSSRKGGVASFEASYTVGKRLPESDLGSLEYFLLERYLLFSELKGRLQVGQVHHVPYPAYSATVECLDQELLLSHGLGETWGAPDWIHYSPGVDVDIFPLESVANS